MTGDIKDNKGFSLIEVLVATAVISIIMVAATALLVTLFRAQREAREMLAMQTHARYVVNLITEHTHNAFIDYDFYTGGNPSAQEEFLALRTTEGIQTVFWFKKQGGQATLWLCDEKPIDQTCAANTDTDWSQVTPNDFLLSVGQFTITPSSSPYFTTDGSAPADVSPVVTLRLKLQMQRTGNESDLIQTALTPRYYVR